MALQFQGWGVSESLFFFLIILFIYLLFLAALGLCCCTCFSLVVASGGCSLVVVLRLLNVVVSRVAEHRLWSTGSAAVALGLSCSSACGILLDQGSNPSPPQWQADSHPLSHQGSPESFFLWPLLEVHLLHSPPTIPGGLWAVLVFARSI